jgi:hypothetical protein
MAHKITIRPDSKHDREKFLTACTCGVEGRFLTLDEAKQFAQTHVQHYGLLQSDIVVLDKPLPTPGLPGQPKAAVLGAWTGPERRKQAQKISFADRRLVNAKPSSVPPYVKGGAVSSAPSQDPPPYVRQR